MTAVDQIIDRLDTCQSLDDLREACAPLGLHRSRRFLHLELDIITRCNLRCVMCYHSLDKYRRAPAVTMSPAQFAELAESVLPFAERLTLSLGAEPLMSPHVIDILRIGASHGVPDVSLFTNGLLLTERVADAMIQFGMTQVCISIDGATRGTYNGIRRDGDFDALVDNVRGLVARRRAAASATPRIRFDVVMMQRNIHELPEIVSLASRLGVDALSLRHLVSYEGLDTDRESLRHTKALSNYWLERALAAATARGIEVQTRPALFELGTASDDAPETVTAPQPPDAFAAVTPYCPFPFFHISMSPGGDVLACPHCHGEAPYGRVDRDGPVDLIWLNASFMELRKRILRRDPPAMCRRCPFLGDRYPDLANMFATRSPVPD